MTVTSILLAALSAVSIVSSAQAATFDFSFNDGADSGSGQFTAPAGLSPYTVTEISGSVDGFAITGLSGYGNSDQLLYEPAPFFDHAGIAFSAANSLSYNLFTTSGSYLLCASNVYATCGGFDGIPTSVTVTAVGSVPEPASWALMIVGLGVTGFAMRRGRVGVSYG